MLEGEMAKQKESGLGAEHLLPFERADGDSEGDSTEKLFSILESDPVLGDQPSEDEPEGDESGKPTDDSGERHAPESDEEDDDSGDESDDADDESGESGEDDGQGGGDEEDLDALYQRLRAAGYKRRVKVAGEEIEATLDELDQGYSRTADYTRKTTETKQEKDAYRQAREKYAQGLEQLEKLLTASKPRERSADEWDRLREEDPTQYNLEWTDHTRQRDAERALEEERAKVAREQAADVQKQFEEFAGAEARRLHEAVPEFADPKEGPAAKRKLVDYLTGTSYSFTDDELKMVVDHRLYVLAEKARRYDELQANGKTKIRGSREKAGARVLQPGGRRQSGAKPRGDERARSQLRDRLKKTGRQDLAEDVMYNLLGAEEEASKRRR